MCVEYTPVYNTYGQEINRTEAGAAEHDSWNLTKFSIDMLKIRPYRYQHLIFKYFLNPKIKRIAICKSRQIGISTAIEIMAIEAAYTNRFPSGIFNNTKIGIVSKSDKQAKKVLYDIQKFMSMADSYNETKPFFNSLDTGRFIPQNMFERSFKNKSFIKCFPPTDAIRGEALDIVFVDEGAFIDDNTFYDSIEPTTSKTNGKIVISSTPNGQRGYFFEIFDPFDKFKNHEYQRFWFNWKQCEDLVQKKIIKEKYEIAKQTGNLRNFEQEYNAMFTVDEASFFEDSDITKGIDPELAMVYQWHETPCCLSIDYGQTQSATCLTVKTKFKGNIITLFQWAAKEFDENLLMDNSFEHAVKNMMDRYSIRWIVVDDCSQGYRTNKQLENEGYPVRRFVFSGGGKGGEKNKVYYNYRGALKKGIIKYPKIPELLIEMRALMEIRMKVFTSIEKPKGGNDDRIDGEIMATIPFIEEEGDFESVIVASNPTPKNYGMRKGWHDHEWDRIKANYPDPSVN